jgi:hypothetical protein
MFEFCLTIMNGYNFDIYEWIVLLPRHDNLLEKSSKQIKVIVTFTNDLGAQIL